MMPERGGSSRTRMVHGIFYGLNGQTDNLHYVSFSVHTSERVVRYTLEWSECDLDHVHVS